MEPPSLPEATSSSAPSSPPEKAPTALDIWAAFDLDGRRAALDEEGLCIARRQDTSAASRKELASGTKNFKRFKGSEEGKSKAFAVLLKLYQGEIDALTARAKAAEGAFLGLYKGLYEVVDPVKELQRGEEVRADLGLVKEELRAVRVERGALVERGGVVEESEERVRVLERELKDVRERTGEEGRRVVAEKQEVWETAQRKALEAYEMREQELLCQVGLANERMREIQADVDVVRSERNEAQTQLRDLKEAREAGVEMMAEDGVRVREEAEELRRRCEMLERRSGPGVGRKGIVEEAEIASKDVEISQLKDQVMALEEVLGGKDSEKSNEFAKLARSIEEKDGQIGALKASLADLPSKEEYTTMRRQFEVLNEFQLNDVGVDGASVVSSSVGGEDGGEDRGQGKTGGGSTAAIDLEKRLLGKLKAMESKTAAMRVELSGKDSRIQELGSLVSSLEERNEDSKSLIIKLEDGINAMTGKSGSASGLKARYSMERGGLGSGMQSPTISSTSLSAGVDGGAIAATSEEVGGDGANDEDGESSAWDWGERQQAAGLERLMSEEPTMLDIVSGQRDRFRSRTVELETDNRKVAERLERVTGDVDHLKADNVRLYEKIRYLQSYGGGGSAAGSTSVKPIHSANNSSVSIGGMDEEEGMGGILGQYRSMYEEMVNPYTLFNRRERHKRLSEMSVPERLTMRASQRATSTKSSRLFVFTYVVLLHALVFFVIAFSSRCGDDKVSTKAVH